MLIFDKNKQYEKLINEGFEKYPNKRDLLILCEHWLKEDGCELVDLKDNIIKFCIKCNSQFNVAKSENLIINVLKEIEKRQEGHVAFEFNSTIILYKSEIDTIRAISDKELKKIAFVILCLAKWRNADYIYINSESTIKVKDIFNLAKIKTTQKKQTRILYRLNDVGFIDVQLKPILKLFIPCISQRPENDIAIKDFKISDDMICEWKEFFGQMCERCGKIFDRPGRCNKYCEECSKIVKNEKTNALKRQKRAQRQNL